MLQFIKGIEETEKRHYKEKTTGVDIPDKACCPKKSSHVAEILETVVLETPNLLVKHKFTKYAHQ